MRELLVLSVAGIGIFVIYQLHSWMTLTDLDIARIDKDIQKIKEKLGIKEGK